MAFNFRNETKHQVTIATEPSVYEIFVEPGEEIEMEEEYDASTELRPNRAGMTQIVFSDRYIRVYPKDDSAVFIIRQKGKEIRW